ncbi:MAG: hypothetical protein SW833_17415 [Cyanobacteriota bacterium]|nr:hypothetical protein [Cyanobacteriota bacterium]
MREDFGPKAQKRAKFLLDVLLTYANGEGEYPELSIKTYWKTSNQLVVRTRIRYLEELIVLGGYKGKFGKDQIKEALKNLENFLEILQDNREGRGPGLRCWHFTLELWYERQDKQLILERFDLEWERQRNQRGNAA